MKNMLDTGVWWNFIKMKIQDTVIFAVSVSSVRIVHLHRGSYYTEFGAAIESIAGVLLCLIGER